MDIKNRVEKMAHDLEKLIDRAEIWQLLFDECPLGVCVLNSGMKFFLINKEFARITGYDTEILGKQISEVIPVKFRRMHKKMEKQFASNPQRRINTHDLHPYILRKDGIEVPVDIILSYIKYDGTIYYVSFIKEILEEVL